MCKQIKQINSYVYIVMFKYKIFSSVFNSKRLQTFFQYTNTHKHTHFLEQNTSIEMWRENKWWQKRDSFRRQDFVYRRFLKTKSKYFPCHSGSMFAFEILYPYVSFSAPMCECVSYIQRILPNIIEPIRIRIRNQSQFIDCLND